MLLYHKHECETGKAPKDKCLYVLYVKSKCFTSSTE
jgi:hypothetical protein